MTNCSRAAALLLVLALGCNLDGSSNPVDIPATETGIDVPDVQDPADLNSGDEAGDTTSELTDLGEEDVHKTCQSVLDDWQCVDQAGCPEWAACLGVGSCEEPPCWGLCDDFPGSCLPRTDTTLCEADGDCAGTTVCVGSVLFESGAVKAPGLCRSRPSEEACFDDSHCSGDRYCAGELNCTAEAYCPGPEFYGKCVDKPPAGQCWEAGDCAQGQRCAGAVLCDFGDAQCGEDVMGTCEEGPGASCVMDEDCDGNPAGGFCTGSFVCEGSDCAFGDVAGFCAGPPGFGGCWEESDCLADTQVCRAFLACPPGSLCSQSVAHVGQCGEAPATGEGVAVGLADTKVQVTVPFWITLINRGPATIYVDPCFAMLLQRWNGNEEIWIDWPTTVEHDSCVEGQPAPYLAIPPGNGMVFGGKMEEWEQATYRLETIYQVGCAQGEINPDCKSGPLKANSLEFDAVPAGPSDA
ncbi:MAG: hypothetical protein ISR64_11230 [Deltaproteobacteria bacterium]|nr:hypothetical protein [Deltaproteobacteria bacterium]